MARLAAGPRLSPVRELARRGTDSDSRPFIVCSMPERAQKSQAPARKTVRRTAHAKEVAEESSGSAIDVTPGLELKVTAPATVVSRGKDSAAGPPPVNDNRPEMVASCGLRTQKERTNQHSHATRSKRRKQNARMESRAEERKEFVQREGGEGGVGVDVHGTPRLFELEHSNSQYTRRT